MRSEKRKSPRIGEEVERHRVKKETVGKEREQVDDSLDRQQWVQVGRASTGSKRWLRYQ